MAALYLQLLFLICCSGYLAPALEPPQPPEPVIHMLQVHAGPTTKPGLALYYCAVESALCHLGKNASIVIWSKNVTNTRRDLQTLMKGSPCHGTNLRVEPLDYELIFKDTPLGIWYQHLDKRKKLYNQNLGNAARLALVFLYGGLFVDSDLIVYNSKIMNLTAPAFALESPNVISSAFMSFPSPRHEMLWHIMQSFVSEFNGGQSGWNGPQLLTRFVNSSCWGERQAWYCSSINILPASVLYPVRWQDAQWILNHPNDTHKAADGKMVHHHLQDVIARSWAYQLWNHRLSTAQDRYCVRPDSNLEGLMQMNCPAALEGFRNVLRCTSHGTGRTGRQGKEKAVVSTTPPQQRHNHSNTTASAHFGMNAGLHLAYHPINHDQHIVLWNPEAEMLLWAPLPGDCKPPCWKLFRAKAIVLRLLHEQHAEGTDRGLGALQPPPPPPGVQSIRSVTVSLNRPPNSNYSVAFLRNNVQQHALQLLAAVQPPPPVAVSHAHHLHHASYAFYTSPFRRALALSIDAGGPDGQIFTIWNASCATGQAPTLLSACDLCIVGWLYEAVRKVNKKKLDALSFASVSVLPDLRYGQHLEHFLRTDVLPKTYVLFIVLTVFLGPRPGALPLGEHINV